MKNTIKVDHENNSIIMDRTFAKLAENAHSEEYTTLQNVRRDYPTYKVKTRTIRKNTYKETYAGLTYSYMEYYIRTHESVNTIAAVMGEFEEMRLISQCHSRAFRYPTIKKWFLEKYPEVMKFGVKPTAGIDGAGDFEDVEIIPPAAADSVA